MNADTYLEQWGEYYADPNINVLYPLMKNIANNLVTILTVSYPYELAVMRGRLEAEGIECFVQDELTTQVNPFFSNAIGGVKLQVRESDYEKTIAILKAGGYLDSSEIQQPKFKNKPHTSGSKITKSNKMSFLLHLLIAIAITVALILTGTFYTQTSILNP